MGSLGSKTNLLKKTQRKVLLLVVHLYWFSTYIHLLFFMSLLAKAIAAGQDLFNTISQFMKILGGTPPPPHHRHNHCRYT